MSIRAVALSALLLLACGDPKPAAAPTASEASSHTIDGPKAKALVAGGAKLVDVRSPEEYATQHIAGAENVPESKVAEHDLGAKDQPIVLYCHSGRRSAKAAETLRAKGYTRVYELGAMTNWDESK